MSDPLAVIRTELESRLATWAAAQTPKIPISYEAVAFTKPSTGVFLEVELHPAVTLDRDVSGVSQRHLGLFVVNCWARSGRGMAEVEALASNIINLFPMLPKQGDVSIESTPYTEGLNLDSAGWVIIPVTIKYRYET